MSDVVEMAWAIAAGTPWWVYALFAFLMAQGIKAMRPSTGPLWRLAIIPAVFAIWGLYELATRFGMTAATLGEWIGAFALGALVGSMLARRLRIGADRARGWVSLPGGPQTLTLILIIFAANYALGVTSAMAPDVADSPLFRIAKIAVSGLATGAFTGKFLQLWHKYRMAPQENLDEDLGAGTA